MWVPAKCCFSTQHNVWMRTGTHWGAFMIKLQQDSWLIKPKTNGGTLFNCNQTMQLKNKMSFWNIKFHLFYQLTGAKGKEKLFVFTQLIGGKRKSIFTLYLNKLTQSFTDVFNYILTCLLTCYCILSALGLHTVSAWTPPRLENPLLVSHWCYKHCSCLMSKDDSQRDRESNRG